MKHRDHDDPEIFKECVSAITLKGRPEGLLEEWLTEAEVIITVAPGPRRGPKAAQQWLAVDELDELPWASKIREAVIQSDHLEASSGLFMLSDVQNLTIVILGESFAKDDIELFQNAISNLPKLQHLRVVVAAGALNTANECIAGLGSGFTTEIIANTNAHGRRRL